MSQEASGPGDSESGNKSNRFDLDKNVNDTNKSVTVSGETGKFPQFEASQSSPSDKSLGISDQNSSPLSGSKGVPGDRDKSVRKSASILKNTSILKARPMLQASSPFGGALRNQNLSMGI